MTDPHTIDLMFRMCLAVAVFLLLIMLVVALVPGFRRPYLARLFPFTSRVLDIVAWSSRTFYTWLRRLPPKFSTPALALLIVFFCAFPYAAYALLTLPPLPFTLGEGAGERAAWYAIGTGVRLLFVTAASAVAAMLAWVWLNLSFLIAGLIYTRWRRPVPRWLPGWLDSTAAMTGAAAGTPDPEVAAELGRFERIGIILAGGARRGHIRPARSGPSTSS
jgi:hypothetical protein